MKKEQRYTQYMTGKYSFLFSIGSTESRRFYSWKYMLEAAHTKDVGLKRWLTPPLWPCSQRWTTSDVLSHIYCSLPYSLCIDHECNDIRALLVTEPCTDGEGDHWDLWWDGGLCVPGCAQSNIRGLSMQELLHFHTSQSVLDLFFSSQTRTA